jgi:cell division protein FtsL
MIRFLNILAVACLIASAAYAYSIKYETLYYAEQVAKLKTRIQKERDSVAVLKAEWQHLNRPDRLQEAVARHLDLQPISPQQLARLSDLPNKPPKVDEIARLLSQGTTPKEKRPDPRTTGSTTPSVRR